MSFSLFAGYNTLVGKTNRMIAATGLKKGIAFLLGGKPFKVEKYTHQKIARSGGNIKLAVRDLEDGDLKEKTVRPGMRFEEIDTQKRKLQYLYKNSTTAFFMDTRSFEQVEVSLKVISKNLRFFKEGENLNVLFWDKKPLSVEIPAKVTLKVMETNPGVKGNSATNIYKPAVLENGLKLKVPLFIKEQDKIRVDTKTGEYVERAG